MKPIENLDAVIRKTENKLGHSRRRAKQTNEKHEGIKDNGGVITEHGGWDRGYWEGRVAVLEDLLDDLNELKAFKTERVDNA
ncbi:hypothetical protein [Metabacillus sp. SLBN-84]